MRMEETYMYDPYIRLPLNHKSSNNANKTAIYCLIKHDYNLT